MRKVILLLLLSAGAAGTLLGASSSSLCFPGVGCLVTDGTDLYLDEDDDGILDPTELNLTINAPNAVGDQTIQGVATVNSTVSFAAASLLFDGIDLELLQSGADRYFQADLQNTTTPHRPASGDCDAAAEAGRIVVMSGTNIAEGQAALCYCAADTESAIPEWRCHRGVDP